MSRIYLFVGKNIPPIKSSTLQSFDKKYIQRFLYSANDLSLLLRHHPSGEFITEQLRNALFEGMKAYLNVLMLFEDTDAVKREIGDHVPTEVEWKQIFIIQKIIQPVTTSFIEWMSQDSILLLQAVNQVIDILKQLHPPAKMRRVEDKVFSEYTCKV